MDHMNPTQMISSKESMNSRRAVPPGNGGDLLKTDRSGVQMGKNVLMRLVQGSRLM